MDAAGCNQPEEPGFSLWMCQPRLGFKELLNAEDSTGVTQMGTGGDSWLEESCRLEGNCWVGEEADDG